MIRDFKTWARRERGKEPVVSIICAIGVDFEGVERWGMRTEARRLRDSWGVLDSELLRVWGYMTKTRNKNARSLRNRIEHHPPPILTMKLHLPSFKVISKNRLLIYLARPQTCIKNKLTKIPSPSLPSALTPTTIPLSIPLPPSVASPPSKSSSRISHPVLTLCLS